MPVEKVGAIKDFRQRLLTVCLLQKAFLATYPFPLGWSWFELCELAQCLCGLEAIAGCDMGILHDTPFLIDVQVICTGHAQFAE